MTKQAGNLIKYTAEARAKRLGLILPSRENDNNNKEAYFEKFRGLEFWIWDVKKHRKEHKEKGDLCCFNHAIGPFFKNDKPHWIYSWQEQIISALHNYRRIYLLKAGGIGATSLLLRHMCWLCLRNDDMRGKNMVIITSPRLELSVDLMRRLKALFSDVYFDSKETVAVINQCRIESFPSHNLRSLRGLVDTKYVLADEAAHWNLGFESDEIRTVIERMIQKSNPYIALVSTPNRPNDLMQQIHNEPASSCLYYRLYLDYKVALGTLFSEEEIQLAMRSPSFAREMQLQWLGTVGNVLSVNTINRMIELGKLYDPDRPLPYARKVIGVDTGFASSKTGITVLQIGNKSKIEVIFAEEYENIEFSRLINIILNLKNKIYAAKIFIDASNTPVIRTLKEHLGDRVDYQRHLEELRRAKLEDYVAYYMKVVPIAFGSSTNGGPAMLGNLKQLADVGKIAVNQKFTKLITSLRSATAVEFKLDKDATVHDDIFDSFILALDYFRVVSSPRAILEE